MVTGYGLNEGQDGRWSDNTAVSMRQVLLLNVNASGPHWYLCTRRNEEQIPATKRRSPPRMRPLLRHTGKHRGGARRSRLWNATSPDPVYSPGPFQPVRHVPPCSRVEGARRRARDEGSAKDERGAGKKREEIALSRHRGPLADQLQPALRGKIAKPTSFASIVRGIYTSVGWIEPLRWFINDRILIFY